MRLLKIDANDELTLTNDLTENIPPYAILSHTWQSDTDEVTFNDLNDGSGKNKAGYSKIYLCGKQAQSDDLLYFWVDTCCIDRANHVELSEAITSMFGWYRNAVKCYAYLADVSSPGDNHEDQTPGKWELEFRRSRWFRRGWTLQELLAPKVVEFYSQNGEFLGDKTTLETQLHEITGVPISALQGASLTEFSVAERMRWAANRDTKKKEDRAYCLLGIFDVSMSLRYGEGERAFLRLENKVNKSSKYSEMVSWLAPVRPEELHAKILASRHPDSGLSFTQGPLMSWLQSGPGHDSLMWITGKSGSGKTTLFSSAVETVKTFASGNPSTLFAYYYCAFSDQDSQQLVNILGSLVVQVSAWQPAILEDVKGNFARESAREQDKILQIGELRRILVKHIATFSTIVILIDALDESNDFFETVNCILCLLLQLPNLKILVTSTRRPPTSVTTRWSSLVEVEIQPDEDIRIFVEANFSEHAVLRGLSSQSKDMVRSALIGNADQSFRWICLVLDNLCKQRTGRAVTSALLQLPKGLDRIYASMLSRIPAEDRRIAREVLLWLSFAMRPLTLVELSEAAILEVSDTTLNQDCRLHEPEVLLEICHGFLQYDVDSNKVKLAHASVKDYLVSEPIGNDDASFFSLRPDLAHQELMQKCLTYLMFDDFRSGFIPEPDVMESRQKDFPLLKYAAYFWGSHASFATDNEWTLLHKFFSTRTLPRRGNYGTWAHCLYHRAGVLSTYGQRRMENLVNSEPLYYAASYGMAPIMRHLLSQDTTVDLEQPGGRYGSTALQVACFRRNKEVAEILVAAGADSGSEDKGSHLPAWYWAQVNGWKDLVERMSQLRPQITEFSALTEEDIISGRTHQEAFYHKQDDQLGKHSAGTGPRKEV